MSFIHSGFLNKRGISITSWQRKFFAISSSSHVECWDSAEAFQKPGAMPNGRIACKGLTVVETPAKTQKPFQFELQDGSKRPWILAADSAEDKEEWIDVIRSCVAEFEEETDQQVTPEPEAGNNSGPQCKPTEELDVADLTKRSKLSEHPQKSLKCSKLNSRHAVVTISSIFTTHPDCVTSIEYLSCHVESFAISDVITLLKRTSQRDGNYKVFEACSPKLVFALPWDCEPIYKHLYPPANNVLARDYIVSVSGSNNVHSHTSIESSIPTNEMLIEAIASAKVRPQKSSVLNSWLASVPNPVFSPDDLAKLVQKFSGAQRMEVLEQVSKLTERINVQQMVALLKELSSKAEKLDVLRLVAHKLDYQSDSDLEPLMKLFPSAKDKQTVQATLESTTMNLEESPVEQNIKQDATSVMVQHPVQQPSVPPQKAIRQQPATPQTTSQQPAVQQPATPQTIPQPEVNAFIFTQFKKKIGAAKSVDEKLEVMESESGATLTVKEVQTIAMTLPKDVDRVRAIEILSRYVESFAVADVTSLIVKISDSDAILSIIEVCSHKLVFALPWDCEPIYKVLPQKEKKNFSKGNHCFCPKQQLNRAFNSHL
ncbi:hypothetical protein GEMRC1_005509 [Eukaryota sp. GEM-RC1]